MCFSAKSSIISFSVGIIGSLLCILLGTAVDKIVGYFFAFVSSMQIIEYLLWTHQKCDNYNRFISMLGMVFNHLQPIVLAILVLYFNPKTPYKKWIALIMAIYLCVIIPYSYQFLQHKSNQCTLKGTDNHLFWHWNNMSYCCFVYIIFLISLSTFWLLGLPPFKLGLIFATISIVSYLSSMYVYPHKNMGAMWCYYAVFIPIIYYIIRVVIVKNVKY